MVERRVLLLWKLAGEPEGCARAKFGLNLQLATHHFNQLPADSQAQTGSAMFAGGGTIGLGKLFKNAGLGLLADALTRVGNFKTNRDVRIGL